MKKLFVIFCSLLFIGCLVKNKPDSQDKELENHIEAAKLGNSDSLIEVMRALYLSPSEHNNLNPQKAIEVYEQAKKANPNIIMYDQEYDELILKTIKMTLEAGPLDIDAFCNKYNLISKCQKAYGYWSIAEEASKGGRFGSPDMKLTLQLVSYGGHAQAELISAVNEVYNNWKNKEVKEFIYCNHISSGYGMGYCMAKKDEEDELVRNKRLSDIRKKLSSKSYNLIDNAYALAIKFIESKVEYEEGHDGTAIAANVIESEMEQKNQYLEFIEMVQSGYKPLPKSSFIKADRMMNIVYKKVMENVKKNSDSRILPQFDEVQLVQRLWIDYRDATVNLLMAINPKIDADVWKSWLTEIRVEQLKEILSRTEQGF